MIFPALFLVFLCSYSQAADDSSEGDVPFVIASANDEPKVSNLLPESALQLEDEKSSKAHPNPSYPLHLPLFKTGGEMSFDDVAAFAQDGSLDQIYRSQRSPQRRPYFYPSRPSRPSITSWPGQVLPPAWTYPGQGVGQGLGQGAGVRPLPALYGRPMSLLEGIAR